MIVVQSATVFGPTNVHAMRLHGPLSNRCTAFHETLLTLLVDNRVTLLVLAACKRTMQPRTANNKPEKHGQHKRSNCFLYPSYIELKYSIRFDCICRVCRSLYRPKCVCQCWFTKNDKECVCHSVCAYVCHSVYVYVCYGVCEYVTVNCITIETESQLSLLL